MKKQKLFNAKYLVIPQGPKKQLTSEKKAVFIYEQDNKPKRVTKWFQDIYGPFSNGYFIARSKEGVALYHVSEPRKQISQYLQMITLNTIQDDIQFYTGTKDGKSAIFDISDPNQPISKWFKNIYQTWASDFYVAEEDDGTLSIYDISDTKKPIANGYKDVKLEGAFRGLSQYFVASTDGREYSIFLISNPESSIYGGYEDVEIEGLLSGESEYYIAKRNGKKAIFSIKRPNQPLTGWHNKIEASGLLQGKSEYYIAVNDRWTIYHISNPEKPASMDHQFIRINGVLMGESEFYMVRENDKIGIFSIHNPGKPLYGWHDTVIAESAVRGKSPFFATYDNEQDLISIYHIEYGKLSDVYHPSNLIRKYVNLILNGASPHVFFIPVSNRVVALMDIHGSTLGEMLLEDLMNNYQDAVRRYRRDFAHNKDYTIYNDYVQII